MEDRPVMVGIAGDKDRRGAALQGLGVVDRGAMIVQLDAGGLEPQALQPRRSPGGHQHVIEVALAARRTGPGQPHTFALPPGIHLNVQVQGQVLLQDLAQLGLDLQVLQRAQAIVLTEQGDGHTEAGHGLGQFQAHRAGADYGQGARQIGQFEDRLIGQRPLAQGVEGFGYQGVGAGGDDHAAGADRLTIAELQAIRRHETRRRLLGHALGQLGETLLGGGDEMIALTPHPRHDRRAIDADTAHRDAKGAGAADGVMGLPGDDEQLGGHTAHGGTGGASPAVVDQQGARALAPGGAFGGKARGSGPDHGDIAVEIGGGRSGCRVTHLIT